MIYNLPFLFIFYLVILSCYFISNLLITFMLFVKIDFKMIDNIYDIFNCLQNFISMYL